eukprot:COSAG04_NODE_230_length_19216_cov_15.830787_10_plen_69_part_00
MQLLKLRYPNIPPPPPPRLILSYQYPYCRRAIDFISREPNCSKGRARSRLPLRGVCKGAESLIAREPA